jgi:hypothetical protein
MSISSIGIQTVTATTATGAQRSQSAPPPEQQHSASNDNGGGSAPKGDSSQTLGRHVDKRV